MTLKPNTELQGGKYRIIRTIGQGGFGITYLAEQTMMERKVCIKEFFLKEYCDRDDQTSQVSLGTANARALMQKYQEKFLKEARMIAKLDHPNIIRIHDVFTENNTAYYVTDYIDGMNLNDMVKQRGPLPEDEALGYIHAVADGLSYVHSNGINHLDVKPGNIMVRKADGRPILIDFGMSKQYDEGGDQTSSTPIGISEGYAPLEQYNIGGVSTFSPQTDIYSLAATLYRLVTGQVPPKASDVMNEGLPEMPSTISQTTRDAIEKAMQFRKKDRPESMAAFVSLLKIVSSSVSTIETMADAVDDDSESTILSCPLPDESVLSSIATDNESHLPEEAPRHKAKGWLIGGTCVVFMSLLLLFLSLGNKSEMAVYPSRFSQQCNDFSEGLASVFLTEWYGCIKDGKVIDSGGYDVNGRKCWGYIDMTGKLVIPCQFDRAFEFHEGLAAVVVGGKCGYIDKTGQIVIPCQFDTNDPRSTICFAKHFSEGLAPVLVNGKMGFIDTTGQIVIPCQFDSVDNFSDGLAHICIKNGDNYKHGFIDKTGQIVIPCQFDSVGNFSEGLAHIGIRNGYKYKCGFIDKTGQIVIPCQFDGGGNFSDGLARISISNGDNYKHGFIDKTGQIVIPCQFDGAYDFSEGLAHICIKNGDNYKHGFIDKTGQIVIPCQYDFANDFSDGLARICIGRDDGFIDKTGQIVIPPCQFDVVGNFSEGLANALVNGEHVYIDKRGKIVIPRQ